MNSVIRSVALVGVLAAFTAGCGDLVATKAQSTRGPDSASRQGPNPEVEDIPDGNRPGAFPEWAEWTYARADNGKWGYMSREDLSPPVPTTLEEAAALTKKRVDANGDIFVPVYEEKNRKTIVGHFLAGHVSYR